MIKILGVFNEITNTTIPIENFYVLSKHKFIKDAFSYYTKKSEADKVLKSYERGELRTLSALGDLFFFSRILVLYNLIKNEKYDIIHIHHSISSLLVIILTKILASKSKLIFTVHNDFHHYKLFQKLIFRIVLNNVDHVICNSNNTKKSVVDLCDDKKIDVIYNGVNIQKIPKPIKNNHSSVKLLFAHRLVPQKNIMLLLDAILNLHNENYNFDFLLAGDGSQMVLVKDFIEKNKLHNRIKILGKIKRNEVYDLMSSSDVFLVPSIFEGFCNAMVEAMLTKCIVLASNVEPLPEVSGGHDNAVFFDLNKPNDLCSSLRKILTNIDDYRLMAEKSMNFAKSRYSLEICATNHSLLYEKVNKC